MNKEKPASFYDEFFRKKGVTNKAVLEPLFAYIIKMLKKIKVKSVLDIGCGDGYMLSRCRDVGIKGCGFDFSFEAIKLCKDHYKLESVWVGDAREKGHYKGEYGAYLCIEVLEHVIRDFDIIKHLDSNTLFIFSVPNWASENGAHVRCFISDRQIIKRYGRVVDIMGIKKIGTRRVTIGRTK